MRAGRLDFVLPFPLPDEEGRWEIFQVHTKNRPLSADVDLRELARETQGMAGSDISFICKRATILAIADVIGLAPEKRKAGLSVSAAHFKAATAEVQRRGES